MLYYNPKDWYLPIFRIQKSDTFNKLLIMLVFVALYSWGIVYLEREYLQLSKESNARNVTVMHTLLGFAISMLLVFRTNTAYDRWWEGRRLWGGLVNSSRNLAMKLNVMLPPENIECRNFYRQAIPLYASALHKHLLKESTQFQLDENLHPELGPLHKVEHLPNQIAQSIISKTNKLYKDGTISGSQFIIMNEELRSLTDICGACERIKNTPIPYSYSAFIKKFIFIYVLTLPFGFAFNLGYYTVPITTFIFYVLASLEVIAEEIEDPFGKDNNDLPMHKMAENIGNNVEAIFTK